MPTPVINPRYTRKPKRRHKEPKEDPQKFRVYDMEKEIVGWCVNTTMKREDLEDIILHCCRKWRVDVVELKIINKPKLRLYGWTDHAITLNRGHHGMNVGVLLHELAHWIADQRYPDTTPHGPEFAYIYRQLLHDYKMLPKDCFDVLAKRYGVKICGKE